MFYTSQPIKSVQVFSSLFMGENGMRLIDRTGQVYERLTVVSRAPNASPTDTNARWVCQCSCGRRAVAYGQDLARGKVKSCGCFNASRIFKHGHSRSKVYNVWKQMFQRCENENNEAYKNYGQRGIYVDPSWSDFSVFLADMGQPPKGASIERVDNNGPYCKGNCIWAPMKVQQNNSRNNHLVTAFGRTQNVTEWASELGLDRDCIYSRLRMGWDAERTLTTPSQTKKDN